MYKNVDTERLSSDDLSIVVHSLKDERELFCFLNIVLFLFGTYTFSKGFELPFHALITLFVIPLVMLIFGSAIIHNTFSNPLRLVKDIFKAYRSGYRQYKRRLFSH